MVNGMHDEYNKVFLFAINVMLMSSPMRSASSMKLSKLHSSGKTKSLIETDTIVAIQRR